MLHSNILRAFGTAILLALTLRAAAKNEPAAKLQWHNVSADDVVGKGWRDTKSPFDRLPARAEKIVRSAVWDLSHHSAGLYVDFRSDAPSISARWTLTSDRLAMPHMPATGVSGLALYVRQAGKWHYLATGRPTNFPTNEAQLIGGLPAAVREFRLYFPLYNGVTAVEIGVPAGSSLDFAQRSEPPPKPVVIYGTSITQGGCASQPGMSFAAVLGRRLGVPVVNLGFSGNGKTEVEVAKLVAEIDAAVFVLDPLPNLLPAQVKERMPAFIQALRAAHPDTPILLNEKPLYPPIQFVPAQLKSITESNEFLREVFKQQQAAGDRRIQLMPACKLAADSGETTVDGVHPTDIGFVMLADAIEPYLRAALK